MKSSFSTPRGVGPVVVQTVDSLERAMPSKNEASDEHTESKPCPACGCEDFLDVRSDVLPERPVTLMQCEDCGAQYNTGVLPWLGLPRLSNP